MVALVGAVGTLAFASKGKNDGVSELVDLAVRSFPCLPSSSSGLRLDWVQGHVVKDVQGWLVELLAVRPVT
jgi:hypothetical protein